MGRLGSLTCLVAWLALASLAIAQTPPQPEASDLAAEEDIIGRMTTQVFVNGRGPFTFIVDTGANRSALSRGLVEQLALPIHGMGEVHAFTGVFTAPLARVASLRSGAIDIANTLLPVIEGPMLAGADGLLGVEALAERRLIMDFRNQRIIVERANAQLRGPSWHDVEAERNFGNLILARGKIGRLPVNMIIDTGANYSFANTALRNALRTSSSRAETITGSRLSSAARTIVLDEAIFIPLIKFEETELRNVRAYVGDLYIFSLWGMAETPTLVVGMDLLSQVEAVAVDYKRSLIQIRSRPSARRSAVSVIR